MDEAPRSAHDVDKPDIATRVERRSRDTPRGVKRAQQIQAAGAMSTLTFIFDFFASVKITPLTGVTSA